MTNAAALILYTPVLLVTIAVMVLACRRDREQPILHSFVFCCVMAIGWELVTMLCFASWTTAMATYLYDVKLFFVAFIVLALLLFVLRFYRLDQYLRPQLVALLSIVPLITGILALTGPWHDLLRTRLEVVALWPRQVVVTEIGPWYWVHAVYSYILMTIAAVVAISQHLKLPKSKRLPSKLLMGGALVTVFCSALSAAGIVIYPFNLTPVSTGVSMILFYMALCNSGKMDFLLLARNEIFHFMDDAVFVVDADGKLLDSNRSARNWLAELGIHEPVTRFDAIMQFLEDAGAEFHNVPDHDPGVDVSITTSHQTAIYNIQEKRIIGDDGDELGMYVTCTDVTRNRLLINRLAETAELDALTGLQNRWGLDRMVTRLKEEETFPVTLIMGDVNGLKHINDTFGHQQGDLLLRTVAQVLKEFCPAWSEAFRVGGDEFVMLIPGANQDRAENILKGIHTRLEELQTLPFRISISLGVAYEDGDSFSLDDLMRRADDNMYEQKRRASSAV